MPSFFTPVNITTLNLYTIGMYTSLVYLVGGQSDREGNVYATNPDTGISGPVCDDTWDQSDVSWTRPFNAFIN
jgi:hypothetical protein